MASCKDCIHDKVCSEYFHAFWGHTANKHSDLINADPKDCSYFKDSSRFVELPANDGFRTVRNVDDLGRVLIPKCIRREYDINYRDKILFIPINESKILVSKFLGSKEEEQALKERESNAN